MQLTKTMAWPLEETQAGCHRRGLQRRRGQPPARTAVYRRCEDGSRCVLCAEVKQQMSLSYSGKLLRNTHCNVGHALFWGSRGIWRCRRWQTTAGRGCIPEFQCCPIKKKKKKKLNSSFLFQADENVNIFTEMPLRWCARTCRAACISLLPLRGLSTGSCAGPVCRKPTTTVSVHTTKRCCLLRLLIILRLLSEENTHKDRRASVIHSCAPPVGVHLIICH